MLRHAVGLSGGLSYHLKAFRFASSRWAPFRREVDRFLRDTWAPGAREIVVFGPSAGWTLPLDWLATFDHVVAVEPDPIARLLLTARFPRGSTTLEIDSSPERLPWFSRDPARALPTILDEHPNAAILFANVLGQIKLLNDENDVADRGCRRHFLDALQGRDWASFHDVLSSETPLRNPFPDRPPQNIGDLESLARHYFLGAAEVVDHETMWLSENREATFAPWALAPGASHLIGFTSPKKS